MSTVIGLFSRKAMTAPEVDKAADEEALRAVFAAVHRTEPTPTPGYARADVALNDGEAAKGAAYAREQMQQKALQKILDNIREAFGVSPTVKLDADFKDYQNFMAQMPCNLKICAEGRLFESPLSMLGSSAEDALQKLIRRMTHPMTGEFIRKYDDAGVTCQDFRYNRNTGKFDEIVYSKAIVQAFAGKQAASAQPA